MLRDGCQPPRKSVAALLKIFIIRKTSVVLNDFACASICSFDFARGFDLVDVAHLNQHQTAQVFDDLTGKRARVGARVEGAVNGFETVRRLMVEDGRHDVEHGFAGGGAEDSLREGKRDLRASGRELVEQRLRVAHAHPLTDGR